jgi:aubergine-like protein
MKSAMEKMKEEGTIPGVPRICYLIVNKRVNARFFSKAGRNIGNPPMGTVVDSSVTMKSGYDFYLLPARANQGAMTPTYFFVAYDDTGCKADDIQSLAFKLSFTYFNWSGSVRVPAPCLYAHRLAYLLGERPKAGQVPVPHQHWKNTRSLYYI